VRTLSSSLALLVLVGCGGGKEDAAEGTAAGDCRDGADNDADALFDCDDDGCAASPDCEGSADNAAPSGAAIAIEPAAPGDDDDLTCVITTEATDPNGDAVSYRYGWSKNGSDAGIAADTVSASLTAGGDTWTCTVTPNDGTLDGAQTSASVTIAQGNRAPSAPTVSITPAEPTDDDVLTCVIDAESVDPDGDTVTYAYAWSVDGTDAGISGATVNAALTEAGQQWTCAVTASDGELESSAASVSVEVAQELEYFVVFGTEYASVQEADCVNRGGHLAWITSSEENEAVLEACDDLGNVEACRIGIDYPYTEWLSGEALTYTNWNEEAYSAFDYAGYIRSSNDGSWWGIPGTWDDAGNEDWWYICRLPEEGDYSGYRSKVLVPSAG
jgi:hypothetical protein